MKRAINILVILICVHWFQIVVNGQNLLHYALSSNGEKGICLFPEDESGEVYFSAIIEAPYSADSIMSAVDDYISSKTMSENCIVKCLSKTSRMRTYSVQLNLGKLWQSLSVSRFGFGGWTLFVLQRDASHVKFKCIIEARNGKYKYTFIDFETNRTTLTGDAKNDGQPNTIHWQRVNSLIKERDSYTAKKGTTSRKAREDIFDFNSQIAYEAYLYQAEYDATIEFEKGLKNLQYDDSFLYSSLSSKKNDNKEQNKDSILTGFNSEFFLHTDEKFSVNTRQRSKPVTRFALDKGQNVYITSGEHIYEMSGASELIKQTMIDNFWNVVNNIKDADFIMKYIVDTEGVDKAHLLFMTPKGDKEVKFATQFSDESVSDNQEKARKMYLESVLPLYKKIESKKHPKILRMFEIE